MQISSRSASELKRHQTGFHSGMRGNGAVTEPRPRQKPAWPVGSTGVRELPSGCAAAGAHHRVGVAARLTRSARQAQTICRELDRRGCERFHLVTRNREANQQLTGLLADGALEPVRRPEVGEFDLYLIYRWLAGRCRAGPQRCQRSIGDPGGECGRPYPGLPPSARMIGWSARAAVGVQLGGRRPGPPIK
jgi:hypothetical protein